MKHVFKDIASQKFSMPSPVRTVITADFDNDNELEVFFNNIAYRGPSANRLFRYKTDFMQYDCYFYCQLNRLFFVLV